MIRPVIPADVAAVVAIYNHYIETTVVTFEEKPVTAEEMAARVTEISATLPWLVCEDGGLVVGYAYASKWRVRPAYRYSVESTVYLDPAVTGRGWGTRLYTALLDELRARKIHAVIGGIALPNTASVALHEKMGFTQVAQFREVGWKFDRWIDVGYWERLL
jgi:L-amino acid N-acyltransferase YncA